MKIISPRFHGVLDYVVVLAFLCGPSLFNFSGTAATLSYVLAIVHLLVTVLTAFPLGLIKMIPFKVHGVIETLAAIGILAFPWILGFSAEPAARSFYVGAGIVILLVVALTDYKAARAMQPVRAA
jgi:hypothetical protein